MSQNLVILEGLLGRDLEVKYIPSGKAVASGSLAVSFGFGEKKGTDWINFVLWEDLALEAAKVLHKGSKTTLTGRLKTRKYKNSEGVEKTVTEVVVSSFSAPVAKQEKTEQPVDDDSIPF